MARLNPYLLTFLFVLSGSLFGQPNPEVIVADINEDGKVDSLRTFGESGSGFGHKEVVFIDGKTGKRHQLITSSSFGSLISLVEVPEWLAEPEQRALLAVMAAKILPPPAITPDPSLRWIIKGRQSRQQPTDHSHFDLVFAPSPPWLSTTFYPPESYFLPYGKGTYAGEVPTGYDSPEKGLLVYYGHNHRGSKRRTSGQPYELEAVPGLDGKVFRTQHGLVQKNEAGQHRWIFVTDAALTGAPDKLRWTSIGKMAIWNNQLLILQHRKPVSSGESIFLIDLETGRTARLRNELFSDYDDLLTLRVEGDDLLLKGTLPGKSKEGGTFHRFSLANLAKALGDFR
jgi:hypothetical protein